MADLAGAREQRVGAQDQEIGAHPGHQRADAILGEAGIGGAAGETIEHGLAAHRLLGVPAAEGLARGIGARDGGRSEEHTSELQARMRISSAVFYLQTKTKSQLK